jgi:hypothetical protein
MPRMEEKTKKEEAARVPSTALDNPQGSDNE